LDCLPEDRTLHSYCRDRYAADLLRIASRRYRSIRELKRSDFASLLQKPGIVSLTSRCGSGYVDSGLFDHYWQEPGNTFLLTAGLWDGRAGRHAQTSRRGLNLVLRLNFNRQHDRLFSQTIRPNHCSAFNGYGHPVLQRGERSYFRGTLAWARLDVDLSAGEVLVEEVQSDWVREVSRLERRIVGRSSDESELPGYCWAPPTSLYSQLPKNSASERPRRYLPCSQADPCARNSTDTRLHRVSSNSNYEKEITMPIQQTLNKGKVPVHIWTGDTESHALNQLTNISQMPFVHHHVAAMPDVHAGIGATVGSVIPTKGAIIPAAVGVDIGCGMNAIRTSLRAEDLPESLRQLRNGIERAVPVGFDMHDRDPVKRSTITPLAKGLDAVLERHPGIGKMQKRRPYDIWVRQLASLGGGNHFIELCLDESGDVWVMLHSGSRGIGNVIGRYFINLARRDMADQLGRLPDKDLAYFTEGARYFEDYVQAVGWAQDYALVNRREMMRLTLAAVAMHLPPFTITKEAINCHHNYVVREHHFGADVYITRKGAIRAGEGELGIIPGSMGAKSYIVRGKGDEQSFCSCSHGAGRRMSRTQAKKAFDQSDLVDQTQGVECRTDKRVIDEIPGAYKDIDKVMENQTDLVEVVHSLKQVLCVKG